MPRCHHCGAQLEMRGKPSRDDNCPECHHDLRVCRNCRHFDAGAWHQCRENQADEVRDKDRGNFCDWFAFREDGPSSPAPGTGGASAGDKAREAFRNLFGDR